MQGKTNRNARRKAETRRRLVEAAQTLFAERGADAVAISEITALADVGFGSFYNYFDSKQAIVDAVVEESLEAMGELIDHATAGASDPAVIVSSGFRAVVRRVHQEPAWGQSIVHAFDHAHGAARPLAERLARDLQLGMDEGRFARLPIDHLVIVIAGIQSGIDRHVAAGRLGPEAGDVGAELVLRMLGVPGDEAAPIAHGPLRLFEPGGTQS